ncbi:diacylglycerol kinase family protein [Ramlibacter sp. AN1015]|uniref:diacylglycerol/lipid kinase family protein n=1 Tax=Ramlibacter sp. AN1015 TaxID=3133428 RepID=UPI0030BB937E
MTHLPELDPAAPVQFVVNAAAGSSDAAAKRAVIESVLHAQGRLGELHFCKPAHLASVAGEAALRALSIRTAVVAVGGDGTLNTVAQGAHAAGCAMGVVPQGTFNYFARVNGIPADPADAIRLLLRASPLPVQVAGINGHVFLVNASLGLYPELLEDREAYKSRFGRSRWVALVAAGATLLRAPRRFRLHIEMGGTVRELEALALFAGNNRLQLQQLGAEPEDSLPGTPGDGSMAGLVLRPIGRLSMLRLMLHGAMGRLGEAAGVERFEFEHLVVRPTLPQGRRGVKVAFDGEVTTMRAPLDFRVLAKPLYLLRPRRSVAAERAGSSTDGPVY